jgi:hypothetical protein
MKKTHVIFVIGTLALFLGAMYHPVNGDIPETNLGTLQCQVTFPDGRVRLFQKAIPLMGIQFLIALFNKLKAEPERIPRVIGLLELLDIVPGQMDKDFNVHVFSYGHGDIYVSTFDETHRMNGFLGVMIKPIIFNYGPRGITWAWRGKLIPPAKSFWGKLGRQHGILIGFRGLNIRLNHDLAPDTHLLLGKTLIILHKDLPF